MGVTYYKLEQRYEGDVTKGCSLTSTEIDGNFHFLRGYDIKDVNFEDGLLKFTRVDGEEIVVSGLPEYVESLIDDALSAYTPEISLEDSAFDRETGILTIVVNGEPFEIGGFITDEEKGKIYVGDGLIGTGTVLDPIRINHVNDTGFFATVERVIDYDTNERLPMPEDGGDVSKRYLTREQKSPYGLVYAFSAVTEIDRMLREQGSPWRVPTFEDWVMLLNAQECEDEYRNHGDMNESSLNGNVAGQRLKDISWNEETAGVGLFNVLPIYYETFTTQQGSLMTAPFWSSTVSPIDNGVFGKRFIQKLDGVETIGKGTTYSNKLALRLVRDIETGPDMGTEVINGIAYKTVTMPTYSEDESGNTVMGTAIWTKENVTFEEFLDRSAAKPYNKYPGDHFIFESKEAYDASGSYIYYTNYWEPTEEKWLKRQLAPNDVIIIHDYEGNTDKEYIIALDENGNQILKRHSIDIEDVMPYIEAEASARTEADEEINEQIDGLSIAIVRERGDRISGDTVLQNQIDALSGQAVEIVESALTRERNERISGDTALQSQIDSLSGQTVEIVESALTRERNERISGDTALQSQIDSLSGQAVEIVESALTRERNERISGDTALQSQIDSLSGQTVEIVESALTQERNERISGDTALQDQISGLTVALEQERNDRQVGDTMHLALAKQYAFNLYKGSDAIVISPARGNVDEITARTVSLKVTEGEKVLLQNEDGLKTILGLNYNTGTTEIELLGINDAVIASIDASDFIKSGLLKRVELIDSEEKRQQDDEEGNPDDVPYLLLEWEISGGETVAVRISLKDFIDVYTGGSGITVSGNVVSIDLDDTNESEFLTLTEDGLKLSGVRNAINDAKTRVYGVQGNVHIIVTGETMPDGHVVYEISENDIASRSALTEVTTLLDSNKPYIEKDIVSRDGDVIIPSGSTITEAAEAIANELDKKDVTAEDIYDGEGNVLIPSGSTITDALKDILEYYIDDEEVVAAALNDLNSRLSTIEEQGTKISGLEAADEDIEIKYLSDGTVTVGVNGISNDEIILS